MAENTVKIATKAAKVPQLVLWDPSKQCIFQAKSFVDNIALAFITKFSGHKQLCVWGFLSTVGTLDSEGSLLVVTILRWTGDDDIASHLYYPLLLKCTFVQESQQYHLSILPHLWILIQDMCVEMLKSTFNYFYHTLNYLLILPGPVESVHFLVSWLMQEVIKDLHKLHHYQLELWVKLQRDNSSGSAPLIISLEIFLTGIILLHAHPHGIYYNCLWFISVGSILWSRWAYKTFGQTDGQGLVYNSETNNYNIQTCSCVANNRNENSPLCLSMQSKSFLSSVLWLQCCSMSAIDCAWKYTQTINISYCWLLNISSGIWGGDVKVVYCYRVVVFVSHILKSDTLLS